MRPTRRLLFFLVTLLVLGLTTPAAAGTDLMKELPQGHDTVIAVDFTELRGSPLYEQTFEALSSQPNFSMLRTQIRDELGIDLKSDLEALAMTSDAPPLSGDMMARPAAALQNAASHHSQGGILMLRGDIDPQAILERLAEGEPDSSTQLRLDGLELRVIDDRTMAVAIGNEAFLDGAQNALDGQRSGPAPIFRQAVDKLGDSQGIYLMISPTISDPDAVRREMGGLASFAALSVDLQSSSVQLGALLRLDDEEQASTLIKEVDQLRNEAAGNPLTALLGIRPVLNNLSLQQSGEEITIRTSMSNRQATRLAGQIGMLTSQGHQLQQPLRGRGIDTIPKESTEDKQDSESSPAPSSDGVDADFN